MDVIYMPHNISNDDVICGDYGIKRCGRMDKVDSVGDGVVLIMSLR